MAFSAWGRPHAACQLQGELRVLDRFSVVASPRTHGILGTESGELRRHARHARRRFSLRYREAAISRVGPCAQRARAGAYNFSRDLGEKNVDTLLDLCVILSVTLMELRTAGF